jgi:hypothetical protein
MSIAMLFWVIMILWLISWGGAWFVPDPRMGYIGGFIVWVCLALLGWHVFGAAIHG